MAKRFLSGRGLARLDGCAPATVIKGTLAGAIGPNSHGFYDTEDARTIKWLARVKRPDRIMSAGTEARFDQVVARVQRLEYEVATWRAFYFERAPLETWLLATADSVSAALARFPEPWALALLWVESERERFGVVVGKAMRGHVGHAMRDMPGAVVRALDNAAARWRTHRPERLRDGGGEVDRLVDDMPETLIAADKRKSEATAALERARVAVSTGKLLAYPAMRHEIVGLVLRWRDALLEQFGAGNCATLLATMGRTATPLALHALHVRLACVLWNVLVQAEGEALDQTIASSTATTRTQSRACGGRCRRSGCRRRTCRRCLSRTAVCWSG